jgi:ethanolamine ammonia-lyase small subunit
MDTSHKTDVISNPWEMLRQFTPARIALGRAGTSLRTLPQLEFQFAHARARDAIHRQIESEPLLAALSQREYEALVLRSAAIDRRIYLQRPDLGRRLNCDSRRALEDRVARLRGGHDVAFVIADGLSALAIEKNAVPFLDAMLPKLAQEKLSIAPIAIVTQGRVAIGDEVGEALGAQMVVVLIGERPGLSSPDSMGIYLTYHPRVGTTDACRNCISNVRREGLSNETAAHKLMYLMTEARRRKLTGVLLKDEAPVPPQPLTARSINFLIENDS